MQGRLGTKKIAQRQHKGQNCNIHFVGVLESKEKGAKERSKKICVYTLERRLHHNRMILGLLMHDIGIALALLCVQRRSNSVIVSPSQCCRPCHALPSRRPLLSSRALLLLGEQGAVLAVGSCRAEIIIVKCRHHHRLKLSWFGSFPTPNAIYVFGELISIRWQRMEAHHFQYQLMTVLHSSVRAKGCSVVLSSRLVPINQLDY